MVSEVLNHLSLYGFAIAHNKAARNSIAQNKSFITVSASACWPEVADAGWAWLDSSASYCASVGWGGGSAPSFLTLLGPMG